MQKILLLISGILCLFYSANAQLNTTGTFLFDFDWKFQKGGCLGADKPDHIDSLWRSIQLPHDWSIENLPDSKSPFNKFAISQASTGFTEGGVGWYRKTFTIDSSFISKTISLRFDGVYNQAEIYVNGNKALTHLNGYTSFDVELSHFILYNKPNVIAVKVTNYGENTRWYSGSGIYRHVWLIVKNPIHIQSNGVCIKTPVVSEKKSIITIETTLRNKSNIATDVILNTEILYNDKKIKGKNSKLSILAGDSVCFIENIELENVLLWSLETPHLYKAINKIYSHNKLTDSVVTTFGIRSISIDSKEGFKLNGTSLKLKGGCVHHDNGPLGAKAYDRAEIRKVQLLKKNGYNAVRTAHNPPSPAFLDACDSIGLLVIDEAFDMWNLAKNPNDYHLYFNNNWQSDLKSMVYRDRNHPSVIMWSIGNEIPGIETSSVANTGKQLANYCRQIDSTRPITIAVHNVNETKDSIFGVVDIAGYNYAFQKYSEDIKRVQDRIIVATESFPLEAFDYWMAVEEFPAVIGDFVWTAFDYIGEASIGWRGFPQDENTFPWNLAYCGDVDICGWKRPQSYYRDVLWNTEPTVSLFVKPPFSTFPFSATKASWSNWNWYDVLADWTWPGYENKPLSVDVYSNCDEVELFINSISLGRKQTNRINRFIANWDVIYQPGTIKAIGYNKGKKVHETELITAGNATQIKLFADRTIILADGQDLCYVTVELIDSKGILHPKADNLITFEVEGPGSIIGVGNANPISLESYTNPERKAWNGKCLVIIKADKKVGEIVLKAKAKDIGTAQIKIEVLK